MDHDVVSLTPCRIATIPHERLRDITDRFPHLSRVLWLTTLIEGAVHREWLVAMGRRTTLAHMTHLICELFIRLQAVGLTRGQSFDLPMTQEELGDTLGFSNVHVNRVLKALREEDQVDWTARQTVIIKDWDGLVCVAEFDPTYLNLEGKPL
jgi:CRP-like cAMP-binding protein